MTTIALSPDPRLAYWPTPPEVAEDVVLQALEPWHGRGDGVRVLEPSAGEGHLAAAVRVWLPEAHITCVEPCSDRAERLRARAGATDEVVEATLEEYLVRVAFEAMAGTWQGFHLVVMNPPFALQGRPEAWAEHILALLDDSHVMSPDAVLSAVVPRVVMTGQSRLVRKVRSMLHPYGGMEACRRGAFDGVGAWVSTALLWVQVAVPAPD